MSQIKTSLAVLALSATFALGGCGDTNSKAVFSPDSGHPAGWSTGHKTPGKANTESCFECHGEELDGGIAKVSCTSCHIGSPTAFHPTQWGSYAYARHSQYVRENGTTTCATAVCHGVALTGVGRAPNCATKCHLGGADKYHPSDWINGLPHKSYLNEINNDKTSCRNDACHGEYLKGVFLSGPSCYKCHPATLLEVRP